jgi:hypothetical protein
MNIPDDNNKNLVQYIWVEMLKFFVADPDPGSDAFFTPDLRSGMEKLGSDTGIRDKLP